MDAKTICEECGKDSDEGEIGQFWYGVQLHSPPVSPDDVVVDPFRRSIIHKIYGHKRVFFCYECLAKSAVGREGLISLFREFGIMLLIALPLVILFLLLSLWSLTGDSESVYDFSETVMLLGGIVIYVITIVMVLFFLFLVARPIRKYLSNVLLYRRGKYKKLDVYPDLLAIANYRNLVQLEYGNRKLKFFTEKERKRLAPYKASS